MIDIYTKSRLLLYIIIILLIILVTIGFMLCQCEPKRIMEDNESATENTVIETVVEENKITIETESDKDGDTNQAVKPVSLGIFKLTAYCPCEKCCGKWANNRPDGIIYGAIGEELKEGYSIAVDPNVIPYRTEVIIDGHTYKAQDCGGAIKGNRIDVYFDNHNDALEFGVQYAEVFIKNVK